MLGLWKRSKSEILLRGQMYCQGKVPVCQSWREHHMRRSCYQQALLCRLREKLPELCLLTHMRQILCAKGLSIMNCVCGREVYRLLLCILASNTFYSTGPYVTLLFFSNSLCYRGQKPFSKLSGFTATSYYYTKTQFRKHRLYFAPICP